MNDCEKRFALRGEILGQARDWVKATQNIMEPPDGAELLRIDFKLSVGACQ